MGLHQLSHLSNQLIYLKKYAMTNTRPKQPQGKNNEIKPHKIPKLFATNYPQNISADTRSSTTKKFSSKLFHSDQLGILDQHRAFSSACDLQNSKRYKSPAYTAKLTPTRSGRVLSSQLAVHHEAFRSAHAPRFKVLTHISLRLSTQLSRINSACDAASKTDISSERCTGLVHAIAVTTQLTCPARLNTSQGLSVSVHPIWSNTIRSHTAEQASKMNLSFSTSSALRTDKLLQKHQSAYTSKISIEHENSSHWCSSNLQPKAVSSISLARTMGSACLTLAQLNLPNYTVKSDRHGQTVNKTLSYFLAQNVQLDSKLKAQLNGNHNNTLPNQLALLNSQEPKVHTGKETLEIGADLGTKSKLKTISHFEGKTRNLIQDDVKGYRTSGMSPTPSPQFHHTSQHYLMMLPVDENPITGAEKGDAVSTNHHQKDPAAIGYNVVLLQETFLQGVQLAQRYGTPLLLSVLRFDPMSLWGLVVFLFVLFSGNSGFTSGRGFNPAGGAPGGG
ncbi:mitogen-activated protein kinase kinase kinase YODA-like [Dorcoceras hygrometricum]|uniref:Mitogen-activated protein kinase kinase kinase YODA-like n=1 Tax=Dorcoceras hygrometricum TaxID=472368 RepID=A0A2Z7A8H1_9LAMI|nr:mitogen-activated protein kinase kinase kinase YODA-like [Dorcoceras hygrometricum]